jgi:hypothetical protein
MSNIINYLEQIQKLTNTNLEILKTLNDSFYTKRNNLIAQVDDTSYVIPSFISLENKINMLQENFENLVKAPETCEAYFNFDGNTRAIEVRKYSHVPDSVSLSEVNNFKTEQNDVFKDFLTPVPYINLSLSDIPNDITSVNVKKIIPKNTELRTMFSSKLVSDAESEEAPKRSVVTSYSDANKMLLNYKEDVDYVEYNTIYDLPIRQNVGTGTYIIESVLSDEIDNDLTEYITLKIRNNLSNPLYSNKLTYKLFDDTIERPLQVGDELINYDGTGKVKITEIRTSANTIVVSVVNGEYLNFVGTDSYDSDNDNDIHDMSKLRFHASVDFSKDKYIKVPLEEDQFVFVAVAPINPRLNVQASWGNGLIINAFSLMNDNETQSFKTYYNENVKNIGDVLFEMTSMITAPITELSEYDFNLITQYKPVIDTGILSVMQINKHLNNSETVQNIRNAYNQKKNASNQLEGVQKQINEINEKLMSVSFDDASGLRSVYTSQLNSLNTERNTLLTTITKAIDSISLNVNSAEIPIENAKYRIRGFYVPKNIATINNRNVANNVIGLQVQYRYKNVSSTVGSAMSIANADGSAYIFSDWNNMYNGFNKAKVATCVDGVYSYKYEPSNESKNEPSYNQIDIPISQGETVDVRIRLLYDFGQPYVTVTSDWSDIVNIPFPEEFTKDVPILTIIEENNNDIETNRFKTIIKDLGVESHVNDKVTDQDITYYHKPDTIASGFYTDERRIIPLKDKLLSMSNEIAALKNEILGYAGAASIKVVLGDRQIPLYADQDNTVLLESYDSFSNEGSSDGVYTFANGIVSTMLNIVISNTSNSVLKLYSIFPGSRSKTLNEITWNSKKSDYSIGLTGGVYFKYRGIDEDGDDKGKAIRQTQNQFVTFRVNDVWTSTAYYSSSAKTSTNNVQNSEGISTINTTLGNGLLGMVVYPYLNDKYGMCIASDMVKSYVAINPGEEIIVPMYCEFAAAPLHSSIRKTISFDIRTSLYNDPINYSFSVVGQNTTTIKDKLSIINAHKLKVNSVTPLSASAVTPTFVTTVPIAKTIADIPFASGSQITTTPATDTTSTGSLLVGKPILGSGVNLGSGLVLPENAGNIAGNLGSGVVISGGGNRNGVVSGNIIPGSTFNDNLLVVSDPTLQKVQFTTNDYVLTY